MHIALFFKESIAHQKDWGGNCVAFRAGWQGTKTKCDTCVSFSSLFLLCASVIRNRRRGNISYQVWLSGSSQGTCYSFVLCWGLPPIRVEEKILMNFIEKYFHHWWLWTMYNCLHPTNGRHQSRTISVKKIIVLCTKHHECSVPAIEARSSPTSHRAGNYSLVIPFVVSFEW